MNSSQKNLILQFHLTFVCYKEIIADYLLYGQ